MYGDVERVDLQIGMHAETPPKGFGFSDTAFRVFILMASRRIKSDRFLTDCYTEEYYTKTGLDWIADNSMMTVLSGTTRSWPRPWTASTTPSCPGRRAWRPRAPCPPTRVVSRRSV